MFITRTCRLIAVIASLLTLPYISGCTMSRGNDINPDQVAKIQKGKTTESDLVQMFGEPQSRATDARGNRQLTFSHTQSSASAATAFGFAPYDMKVSALIVTLGSDGTVSDYTETDSHNR